LTRVDHLLRQQELVPHAKASDAAQDAPLSSALSSIVRRVSMVRQLRTVIGTPQAFSMPAANFEVPNPSGACRYTTPPRTAKDSVPRVFSWSARSPPALGSPSQRPACTVLGSLAL